MQDLPPIIAEKILPWPEQAASHFSTLRDTISKAAVDMPDVGPITETLKWGEPAWLPERPRVGTTIRAAWSQKRPKAFGIFLNCRTNLVDTMRDLYPDAFTYHGTRGLLTPLASELPREPLDHVVRMALRYHLNG